MGGKASTVPGLAFRAEFKPETCSPDARSVDVTWTTGARVLRHGWDENWYEELSLDPAHVRMGRLNNGAPFLADHDGYSVARVLGVVQSARLENGRGVATVRFAKAEDDPEADRVFRKIQDGIIRNVSVGYRVHKMEKQEAAANDKVPVYRAVDWEPHEISAVSIGADADAGFRSLVVQEQRTMNEQEKRAAEEAQKAADAKRAAEVEAQIQAAVQAEQARGAEIRKLVSRHAQLDSAFADSLISKGTKVDAARAAILDELVKRQEGTEIDGHSGIEVKVDERDKSMHGAEAAMCQRYGMTDMINAVRARGNKAPAVAQRAFKNIADDAGEFGGMRVTDIARKFLSRSGKNVGNLTDAQAVDMAMRSVNGENTTSDFGTLLANLMYKQSLGQYTLADDTWRKFCKTDSVQDFRPSNRYRLGTFGVLDLMPEGAEYKNRSIPDGLKQPISVVTKGGMLALSRQAIVNDDMGAVMATAGEFGRAAALSIEVDVYALLNANSGLGANFTTANGTQAFFDSSNGNVNGTGSAIAVAALETDRVIMASQKDPSSNEYLGIGKRGNLVLLVPIGLESVAATFNTMQYDGVSNKFESPNFLRGAFKEVVGSPRLTVSTTRRYIFEDPGSQNAGAIVVAFLGDQQAPFLQQQLGWRVDGIEWKLRIDYQAQFFDPKLAVTNAGV